MNLDGHVWCLNLLSGDVSSYILIDGGDSSVKYTYTPTVNAKYVLKFGISISLVRLVDVETTLFTEPRTRVQKNVDWSKHLSVYVETTLHPLCVAAGKRRGTVKVTGRSYSAKTNLIHLLVRS